MVFDVNSVHLQERQTNRRKYYLQLEVDSKTVLLGLLNLKT